MAEKKLDNPGTDPVRLDPSGNESKRTPAVLDIDTFSERTAWPVGTRVQHPTEDVRGFIVKRGGQQWTTRNRLPLVRWDGKLEAVPVPWEDLRKSTHSATRGTE